MEEKKLKHEVIPYIKEISPEVISIIAIGSWTHPKIWKKDISDIDLVCLLPCCPKKRFLSKIYQIQEKIKYLGVKFLFFPKIIDDFQGQQINTKLMFDNQIIDVCWSTPQVNIGSRTEEIIQDNLELYLGNLYFYGLKLYGEFEQKILPKHQPYLEEEIRKTRLKKIKSYLKLSFKEILQAVKSDPLSCLHIYAKFQSILLQYIFLKHRVYPISYTKHLSYQIDLLLKIKNDEKSALINILNFHTSIEEKLSTIFSFYIAQK